MLTRNTCPGPGWKDKLIAEGRRDGDSGEQRGTGEGGRETGED